MTQLPAGTGTEPRQGRVPTTRRGFLATAIGTGAGVGLLTVGRGLAPVPAAAAPTTPPGPTGTPGPMTPTADPPATVTGLIGGSPFYVAHRGGGRSWPEMTAYAYQQATGVPGVTAIEISVCLSADGVLVCSHDPTTTRTTGVRYRIGAQPWATLQQLRVTSAATTDPTQPSRPLSRFEEVIEAHLDRVVAFVEPKTPEAVEPLFAALVASGQAERVVWKQPVNQPHFGRAKAAGFATWGYVLDEPGHIYPPRLARFAASPDIDLLGAPRTESDRFVGTVVAAAAEHGKQTVMWDIRSLQDRERALRLGCAGMMTSDVVGVLGTPR